MGSGSADLRPVLPLAGRMQSRWPGAWRLHEQPWVAQLLPGLPRRWQQRRPSSRHGPFERQRSAGLRHNRRTVSPDSRAGRCGPGPVDDPGAGPWCDRGRQAVFEDRQHDHGLQLHSVFVPDVLAGSPADRHLHGGAGVAACGGDVGSKGRSFTQLLFRFV